MYSVLFSWTRIEGDLENVHDFTKLKSIRVKAVLQFNDRTKTFRELLNPPPTFSVDVWRIIFAGRSLSWDAVVPDAVISSNVHLVARIGHWSSPDYQSNDPMVLFATK